MFKIQKHTLANGLRIVHTKDTSTQMVALNILYQVGAKDEDPDKTGFAHLFEHLMFGGSCNIPDYDEPLENAGGNNNAWTSNDFTNYYLTLPAQNIEVGFWLESDRMLELAFSEESLKVQKQVVCEEFKENNLNEPYGDISLLFRPLAYKKHPYRWSAIGKELSHIEDAILEDVKSFFFKWYAPNNAILAVAGNIEFDEVVRLAEKWFGPIEHRKVPVRDLPKESLQTEPRFLEVERDVPSDCLVKGYHICDYFDPDYYTFDLISDLLANGKSSRLKQELIMRNPSFSEVDAYISGNIDCGLFYLTGKPLPGVSLEESDKLITAELNKLLNEPIAEHELEKVKNIFESNTLFSRMSYLNNASAIARAEMTGQAEDIFTEIDKYRHITDADVKRVIRKHLHPNNCSTLYYRANKNPIKEIETEA
ncbi:MAG TPA: pitrilysin family protein [Bacteroidales bacterium]